MKIIHTSDWHLGKRLYGKNRYLESEKFLDWLLGIIESESADALIVAGDIFDTITPSNKSLEQYYNFLYRVSVLSCCENVIITAGNHDSPSLLTAPKELLRVLNVHVIGNVSENPEDEVIIINKNGRETGAVVCAVPYIREKDIRTAGDNETPGDKSKKMLEGIKMHYSAVVRTAEKKRSPGGEKMPLIVTGHLFAAGGTTVKGDGVREIYVGNLENVGSDIFPDGIDYLALGHLHVPQKAFGCNNMRYCGSPLPVGFSEAKQKKTVVSVEFSGGITDIRDIQVPVFRRLESIKGDTDHIRDKIFELKLSGEPVWAEVIYTGNTVNGDLRGIILDMAKNSRIEILRIKNESLSAGILLREAEGETLDSLTESEVFERCLESSGVSGSQKGELRQTFNEALRLVLEDDGEEWEYDQESLKSRS